MREQKGIKERLAFMLEGMEAQDGFNWNDYEELCRDAHAHIEAQDREITECRRMIALDTVTVNAQVASTDELRAKVADLERKLEAQQKFSMVKIL